MMVRRKRLMQCLPYERNTQRFFRFDRHYEDKGRYLAAALKAYFSQPKHSFTPPLHILFHPGVDVTRRCALEAMVGEDRPILRLSGDFIADDGSLPADYADSVVVLRSNLDYDFAENWCLRSFGRRLVFAWFTDEYFELPDYIRCDFEYRALSPSKEVVRKQLLESPLTDFMACAPLPRLLNRFADYIEMEEWLSLNGFDLFSKARFYSEASPAQREAAFGRDIELLQAIERSLFLKRRTLG